MNIRVPSNTVNSCIFRESVSFLKRTVLHRFSQSVSQLASYYDLLFCTGEELVAIWIPTPSPQYVCTMRVFQNKQFRNILDLRQYGKEEKFLTFTVPAVLLISSVNTPRRFKPQIQPNTLLDQPCLPVVLTTHRPFSRICNHGGVTLYL